MASTSRISTTSLIPESDIQAEDVRLGKGLRHWNHPATNAFRQQVQNLLSTYNHTARSQRKNVCRSLLELLERKGGRLLHKVQGNGSLNCFQVLEGEKALKRIAELFREERKTDHSQPRKSKKRPSESTAGKEAVQKKQRSHKSNLPEGNNIDRATPEPINRSSSTNNNNNKKHDTNTIVTSTSADGHAYKIEKVELCPKTSNVAWNVESAVLNETTDLTEKRMRILLLKILKEIDNKLVYDQIFYQMKRHKPLYLKSIKFNQSVIRYLTDHSKDGEDPFPTLRRLVNSLHAIGYQMYLQIYPPTPEAHCHLTSIHQDGGNQHARISRQLVKLGGETAFYRSSTETSKFCSLNADKGIRAIVASFLAFCGTTDSDPPVNSQVHHAATSGETGAMSITIMADRLVKKKTPTSTTTESDLPSQLRPPRPPCKENPKCKKKPLPETTENAVNVLRVIDFVAKVLWEESDKPELEALNAQIRSMEPALFNDSRIESLPNFSPSGHFKLAIPQEIREAFSTANHSHVYYGTTLIGTQYNPNVDVLYGVTGRVDQGNLRSVVEQTRGYRRFLQIVKTHLPDSQTYDFFKGHKNANFRVGTLNKIIAEFYAESNGGWFFRKLGVVMANGKFPVLRMSYSDFINGEDKAHHLSSLIYNLFRDQRVKKAS